MHELLQPLIDWYLASLESGGYLMIALLMAIESSFVPLPSELVIPPAVAMAQETGRFTLWGIMLAGAVGSWVGASFMYWATRWIGRPLLLRYGKYVLIPPPKVEAAERWADHYGAPGVFLARLLPVVRHLIGIPCGLVKMNFPVYSIYTLLGSGLWCGVLYFVGVAAGNDPKLMAGDLHRLTLWIIGGAVVLGVLYWLLVRRYMRAPSSPK